MLDNKDYDSVLRVFNDKTMLTNSNVAALCGLRNKEQYLAAILSILKTDSPEAMMIRSAIKEKLGVGEWK